jgi:hypothetical protein
MDRGVRGPVARAEALGTRPASLLLSVIGIFKPR